MSLRGRWIMNNKAIGSTFVFLALFLVAFTAFGERGFRVEGMTFNRSGVATPFERTSPIEFFAELECKLDTATVDIVFCMDSSASMGPYIDDLHDGMSYFITQLESHGYDYRLGGVTFDDSTNVWDFDGSTGGYQMTTDDSVFLARMDATGGSVIASDLNEVSLDAICDGIREYDWRADALRIIIMFTNEGYHYLGDGSGWSDETVLGTRSLVFSTGTIVFIAASSRPLPSSPIPATHLENYQNLAWDSGGNWYTISTTWDVIFNDVIALIGTFMSVSADITNVTGSACIVSAELFPLETSCISMLSSNPLVSPTPVPSSATEHFSWNVILDSTCIGIDECFDIVISGGGFVDSAYGCIVDDSCFGYTDLDAESVPPSLTAGCTNVYPNPVTVAVDIVNYGTRPATSISAEFSPIDAGISYIGGDPNPTLIDELIYDGGTATINWLIRVEPSAFGTSPRYDVTVLHLEGTVYHDTLNMIIPDLILPPEVSISADDSIICEGSSTAIHTVVSPSGSWYYSWYPIVGLSDPNIANPIASPTVLTNYTLTVSDGIDCSSNSPILIDVAPEITIDAGGGMMICAGESAVLGGSPTATGGYGSLSYLWTPSSGLDDNSIPNPTASPGTTTTYILTITDEADCEQTDNATVTVIPEIVVDAGIDTVICIDGFAMLGGSPTATGGYGTLHYSWTPTTGLSDPTIANPTATPGDSTDYTLVVTDDAHCSGESSVRVVIAPIIHVDAGLDTMISSGESIILGGSPAAIGGYGDLSYLWIPSIYLSDPYVANPTASPVDSTVYRLLVTDEAGCNAIDSVHIDVLPSALGIIFVQTTSGIVNLRVIDTLAAISAGNGVIMVSLPDGTIGAADLVDTTAANASPVHVRTIYGIRSWRKSFY